MVTTINVAAINVDFEGIFGGEDENRRDIA